MLKSKDDLNWINGFEINGQKDITEKICYLRIQR